MSIKDDQQPTEQSQPPPQYQWEYKTELGIHTRMLEIAGMAKGVAEVEIERLRRKLDKLRYGS